LVTLTGADFSLGTANVFHGGMNPQGVWFATYFYDEGGRFGVIEQLTPSTTLNIDFFVRASVSPTSLVGTMDGVLNVWRQVGGNLPYLDASCLSDRHQFLMTRR
jgi:hypothetical protein